MASVISQAPERTIYDYELRKVDYTIQLACLDESRNLARFHSLEHVTAIETKEGKWERLQEGDLVLLRRFEVDKHKGRKLEAQWEGPYLLADLSWHGRMGRLIDIQSGKVVRVRKSGLQERCHLDDMKLFVPRNLKVLGSDELQGVHGLARRLRKESTNRQEGKVGKDMLEGSRVTLVEVEKIDSWLGLAIGELCNLTGLGQWG